MAYPCDAARCVPVALRAHLNNVGITPAHGTDGGALNVWGNSLAAEHLPRGGRVVVHGVAFDFPFTATGGPDNVRCAGQYVPVTPGRYDWLHLLAAAERRAEDEVWLHFADGAADAEALRVSDHWAAVAAFGEPAGLRSPVMHYRRHVQPGVPGTVWMPRVPVTRRGVLVGIRLPHNVAIHVFAITAHRATPARSAEVAVRSAEVAR